jgi:hypothetical protein
MNLRYGYSLSLDEAKEIEEIIKENLKTNNQLLDTSFDVDELTQFW